MTLLRCKAAFAFLLVSTSTLGFAAQPTIPIRFDYAGAEDLLNAIANKQVSNSDLSRLLAVKGVAAMVANTIKYVPSNTRQGFESAVREVATRGHEVTGDYQLDDVVQNSATIWQTIQLLRAHQQAISEDMARSFHRYAPMVHDVTITLHFVVGGASDGFVLDGDPQPELFVALGKGDQDLPGIELNLKHEAFHVLQKVLAGKQSGMTECVDQPGRLSVPLRLACTTLLEGTASFVADATKASGNGPYIDMWRSRYQRNLRPAHLAADFKTFDTVLQKLQAGSLNWKQAYAASFTPPDTPLYFVGYRMAEAIAQADGPAAIGTSLRQPPLEFFHRYMELCRNHARLPQFSKSTQEWLASSKQSR